MPADRRDGPGAGGGPGAGSPWAPFREGSRGVRAPREAAPDASALPTAFEGSRWRLLSLALRTSALTVLTLGAYRFWMRTRLRRWYWSAVRPGGHPLEYAGDPVEKLLGFLIAVVVLAFYLGIVNLGLMFASLAILEDYVIPTVVTSLGLVPMIFYARYRARRYLLARTRWRGIRFGLEPGAVGYAGRAMAHWAITILTLGVLWPRMTFHLERYRTDRTTFGDRRLRQGGRWQMLLPGAIPVWAGVILTGVGALSAAASEGLAPWAPALLAREAWIAALPLGLVVAGLGAVHYSVRSFRLMADHKTAGGLGLVARPRLRRVVGILALGNLLAVAAAGLLLAALAGAIGGLVAARGIDVIGDPLAGLSSPLVLALGGLAYFALFLAWGALRHAFVTMPLLRHYASTLTITGARDLASVRQAPRDEALEAGGFAEALDLGAAI